jgi:copper chaperone
MPGPMNEKKCLHSWTLTPGLREDRDMTTFNVTGMTCANCVRHVTEAVTSVTGVDSVEVNLEAGTASVQGSTDTEAVIAAIVAAGYQAAV